MGPAVIYMLKKINKIMMNMFETIAVDDSVKANVFGFRENNFCDTQ